ncbi:hypothetical protein JCGZ_11556 [Jatropha curcas]|uniref:MYB family protein n=1 Tax=Jatropha curcas TaxID=180498 RepID=A0A067KFZ9_JATCU|nr:transcription factor MYB35 [Jatropha curcas]AIT52311.1 MYB family protein [Jatropha curcas]KDP31180.1 hypothetical protein JCGZ_11556 [Jatropha curcas]
MGRPPCFDELNVRRGLWTAEEDAKLLAYVSKHGTGNWSALPKKAGLRRCGKSCRLRWTNYLRPDLKHDTFTPHEEELIVRLHAAIGSRWSIIAQQLPGRTDNDIKNYWNTKLRKKLSEMGIDPVTHKPFSQIIADYGNIGCLPRYGNRISSLTRDLKNAFISKPAEGLTISNPNNYNTHHLVPPKMESIQECFLNNGASCNQSLDLLDQLQAIKLVTEATNFLRDQGSLSSSASSSCSNSSSSTCSTAGQEKSALSFSWRDFLLDDAFISNDNHNYQVQEQENFMELSSKGDFTGQIRKMDMAIPTPGTGHQDPSSCSDASFLEAMLDQENEDFLDFPNLLEE